VRSIERIGYLDGDGQKNFCFQRPPSDAVPQRVFLRYDASASRRPNTPWR
jgi:hypothetical protein